MKPGSCAKPFVGVDFVVTDETGNEMEGDNVAGQLGHPQAVGLAWRGTAFGNHGVDICFHT
ncbi:hypothetical protein PsorP6_002942 [Peronosclerospora sorghi]|uniref:Uncharacterized protein n=1 Tax=Peronosclerospora sorghi TaxID=230839 RepID=A0ACC0VPV8_9STRA|nr:hypothetical protein PsorP6_002942 [Peronosclerospora sorghi]